MVVLPSNKIKGNLDIRFYNIVKQGLSRRGNDVTPEEAPELLERLVPQGGPVFQVVNKNGTHTLQRVDTHLELTLTKRPDGINEALEVDF